MIHSSNARFFIILQMSSSCFVKLFSTNDLVYKAVNLLRLPKMLSLLLDQLCYQPCPTGLMAGAKPGGIITVEVFVEWNVITPVRIVLEQLLSTKHCAAAILITTECFDQPV